MGRPGISYRRESGNKRKNQADAALRKRRDRAGTGGQGLLNQCALCAKKNIMRNIAFPLRKEKISKLAEKLKIIPLGGLDEIGKNITVLRRLMLL